MSKQALLRLVFGVFLFLLWLFRQVLTGASGGLFFGHFVLGVVLRIVVVVRRRAARRRAMVASALP